MKGTMKVGDTIADFGRIVSPLLDVIGDSATISSSEPLPAVVSSADKQNLHYPIGHVGAAVSADSLKRLWPQIADWLGARDD